MTEDIRAAAATSLAEVEKVTAVILPEPGREVVALEAAPAPVADAVSALTNLGYSRDQAANAVAAALKNDGEGADSAKLIRLGLKELSR